MACKSLCRTCFWRGYVSSEICCDFANPIYCHGTKTGYFNRNHLRFDDYGVDECPCYLNLPKLPKDYVSSDSSFKLWLAAQDDEVKQQIRKFDVPYKIF
ncbi:hypothetical protein IJK16_01285 [Candidatus Saccharibacteria bacterium]|nr:hypothetical protein [Candidatus Saccharibacteria bacterium]